MSNTSDFVIVNGVLKDYKGAGGDVIVPEGVHTIGDQAFYECRAMKTVTLPSGLKEIQGEYMGAFYGCTGLTSIVLPESVETVGNGVFYGCSNLLEVTMPLAAVSDRMFGGSGKTVIMTLTRPDQEPVRVVASFRKEYWSQSWTYPQEYLLPITDDAIFVYDRLLASGSYDGFGMNEDGRIRGAIWRFEDQKHPVDEEVRAPIIDYLISKITKAVKIAEQDRSAAYIQTLVNVGAINEENQKKVARALAKSTVPEIVAMADHLTPAPSTVATTENAAIDIEPQFVKRLKKLNAAGMLLKLGIDQLPDVLLADGSHEAPKEYLQLIIAEYAGQAKKWDCEFAQLADEAAQKLDRKSLQDAIRTVYDGIENEKKQLPLLLPLFRYADGKTIRDIYPGARSAKWKDETANRALLFSDTREAMLYADKYHLLDQYAKMRGTEADILRDTVLSEFGLDESGKKIYDLGHGNITATLAPDLSLTLFDNTAGKIVKSIPKKNSEPDKYEAAKADFAELKKNVKRVAKGRCDRLFEAFLDGRKFAAETWKQSYTKNPVLNMVARLLVWEQDGKTFIQSESGAIDNKGKSYVITDKPIRVAHPMEMNSSDVQAWQKYFAANGLKQPFVQIWEPVIDPKTVTKNRYTGCMIPFYRFKDQVKHGITVEDYDFHNDITITLADCDAYVERIDWRRHEIKMEDRFEIKNFAFKNYTRQTNHITAYLDRITVWERVKLDDPTVMEILDRFTLAQIMDLVKLAQDVEAKHLLAQLIDYKNTHFAEFDPMDEFTLEW